MDFQWIKFKKVFFADELELFYEVIEVFSRSTCFIGLTVCYLFNGAKELMEVNFKSG